VSDPDKYAFLPTRSPDDLRNIIGYPSGIGALIMKQDFAKKLHRPYFGGGTIETVQVPGLNVTMAAGSRKFEV
jgi:selenocysteine lyase/cysteine desulfurase